MAQANTLAGVDQTKMAELQEKVDYAEPAANIFKSVCDCINALFFSINELFIPCMCCVFASGYAFFATFGLCCAGKCCCTPKTEKPNKGDIEMPSVSSS